MNVLALARELEAEDERLAAEIDAVAEQQRRVAEVAAGAADLEAFAAALPAGRARLEGEVAAAGAELAGREEALRSIAVEDEAERRRAEVRAADLVSVSRRRLDRAREGLAALEARAAAAPDEIARLTAVARKAGHGEPGADLADWASRARAALLVERSSLDTRREQLVREANELASAQLGEQVSTSVAGVRERLERHMLRA